MKTKCLLMGLMLAFVLPAFSFANLPVEPTILKTKAMADEKIDVRLMNLQQEATTLTLENTKGVALFTQTVRNHNGYTVAMDIAELPKGRYILRVTQKDREVTQVVVKDDNGILLSQIK